MSKAFISYNLIHGVLAEMNADQFPSRLCTWNDGTLNLSTNGTHFGYVWKGKPVLNSGIVYHPDSNYGPTHENHPMILKTIVNGKSASLIPEIQTRYR